MKKRRELAADVLTLHAADGRDECIRILRNVQRDAMVRVVQWLIDEDWDEAGTFPDGIPACIDDCVRAQLEELLDEDEL